MAENRADLRALLAAYNAQAAQLAMVVQALQTIREQYGRVCADYELCTHVACESSYGAWATADEALREVCDGTGPRCAGAAGAASARPASVLVDP